MLHQINWGVALMRDARTLTSWASTPQIGGQMMRLSANLRRMRKKPQARPKNNQPKRLGLYRETNSRGRLDQFRALQQNTTSNPLSAPLLCQSTERNCTGKQVKSKIEVRRCYCPLGDTKLLSGISSAFPKDPLIHTHFYTLSNDDVSC